MATVLRKTNPELSLWAAAHNDLKAQIGAGAHFHLDAYETPIASANATDLPTLLVLVNEMRALSVIARADTLAHIIADTATIAAPAATDLATAQTLLNELKSDHNTHCASTAVHYNADATNTCSTTDMSNLGTGLTLANALKTKINAHMADAPSAHSIRVVDA